MDRPLSLFVRSALALPLLASACASAPRALTIGVVERIDSQVLGEARELNVWLPPGFVVGESEAPVVFVLDGGLDEDFQHLAGLVHFLTLYELMPPSIVVGIVNVDRYRDFTHATDVAEDLDRLPTGGGSGPFLDFLAREVIPFVGERYGASGRRMLVGQSMGGLLAAEALVDRPQLFDDYLIVSPSLWWGGEVLAQRAAGAFAAGDRTGKRVFVTLGKEHPEMHRLADAFVAALRGHAEGVEVGYETLPAETHATILHRGAYAGFECFYGKTHQGL
ncbi:MAG: alpha/beta hydrolase-fold protein [bacterium]|nr:alpha/beta hydrolase-fold protein [bacterium]